ncbi:DUF2141 domain-containing protein [Novosphingobium sp. 1949]|uniref:DUF2141 domain-containing protein n=1 Tax=Novosphingobium organovorum TaxID=2930092 RepID=A0ABT0BEG6_9SPHN|nr:DUF2141 domain-containing protein [Novosphingobium organovorum]MCJ2183181.1 DUF2141 domain-containing protein [Novosphingobium organovorum]
MSASLRALLLPPCALAFVAAGAASGADAATRLPSTPDLGQAEGKCRPNERGPAFLVSIKGLKDRQGSLKLEVYPANDTDFLADDNVLVAAGKTFRRVVEPVPATGTPQLCVRLPAPGTYAVTVLHDRDNDRKFKWTYDGIGFARNPKLGWGKPKALAASAQAGNYPTPITIVINYRRGLGMGPLGPD